MRPVSALATTTTPQLWLRLFSVGSVHLTPDLAVLRHDDTATDMHSSQPGFHTTAPMT